MKKITLYIAFYLLPIFLFSQPYLHYTTEQGLPSNHVYQIEQDHDGFIWFATNMGLSKFDGKTFKNFSTKDGLPTNDIWRIEATEDGKLWYFAKSKRLGYIQHDSIYCFPLSDVVQQPRNFIITKNSVAFTGDNQDKYGIFVLKDDKWEMPYSVSREYSLESIQATSILLPENKKIRLIPDSPVLEYIHSKETIPFSHQKLTEAYFDKSVFNKFFYFKEDELYFMINERMISVFNLNNKTFTFILPFDSLKSKVVPELQKHGENYQISQSNSWILVDKELTILSRKNIDMGIKFSHIYQDLSGNFWCASHEKGIYVYPSYTNTTKQYFESEKAQLLESAQNHIFINILGKGIYTKTKNEWKRIIESQTLAYGLGYHNLLKKYYFYTADNYFHSRNLIHSKKIRTIQPTLMGIGITKRDAGAKSLIPFDSGYFAVNASCSLELDSNFSIYHKQIPINDSIYIRGTKSLIEHNGKIFFAGDGISSLDLKSHQYVRSDIPQLQNTINTLVAFDNNYILVGTDGFGIFFFDGEKSVIPIIGSAGLAVNKIVLYNKEIWTATGNGIHIFKGQNNVYHLAESIYDEDGLLENNVNAISILNNTLYVAHDNGVLEIPLESNKYRRKISCYLKEDTYYNSKTNTYSVPYGENITLSFGVLALPSQKYIKTYFKTDKNTDWTQTDVNELFIGNQSPGEYKIRFKAIDQHGNEGETHIKLVVIPLWYQRTSTSILAILVLLVLVILITSYFIRRNDKAKEKQLILSKTMSELELKALRSQMNPHFVFNSLNAIQYYIVKNKKELSEEYLAKFSRLIRLFFEYSKYDALKLEQEIDLLKRYLEIEKLRFENKLDYSISVDPEIDTTEWEIPSMILQTIVDNAVNHGIFHKKGNGHVWLKFDKKSENKLSICIEDDGIGILAMKDLQKNTVGDYKSNSSEVIHERIKILSENKLSKWYLSYQIQDLNTLSTKQTGTRVRIEIEFK